MQYTPDLYALVSIVLCLSQDIFVSFCIVLYGIVLQQCTYFILVKVAHFIASMSDLYTSIVYIVYIFVY